MYMIERFCRSHNKKYIYFYCVICLVLSFVLVEAVAPFIGLADGFKRWNMAKELLENGTIVDNTVMSPIIPMIQAFLYRLTNSYSVFTFVQALSFYLCVGVLNIVLIGQNRIYKKIPIWFICSVVALFIPTFLIFPLLLTDSSFAFVGMVLLTLSALFYLKTNAYIWNCVFAILSVLIIALRANAITVVVILTCVIFVKSTTKRKLLVTVLFAFSVFVGTNFGSTVIEKPYSPQSLGMLWEMLYAEKISHDSLLYDNLSEFGDVDSALDRYNDDYSNGIFWDNNPPFPVWSVADRITASKITVLYISSYFTNSYPYVAKAHFVGRTLGITQPLLSSARGIHTVDNITKQYGAKETSISANIRKWFINFTDAIGLLTLRPVFLFAVVSVLLFVLNKLNKLRSEYSLYFITAISWYFAFCLNTQAHEFRYFAPSFFVLFILTVCGIIIVIPNRPKEGEIKSLRTAGEIH